MGSYSCNSDNFPKSKKKDLHSSLHKKFQELIPRAQIEDTVRKGSKCIQLLFIRRPWMPWRKRILQLPHGSLKSTKRIGFGIYLTPLQKPLIIA